MRLIGVGLPRTGTLTQKLAFEMLGFAPCYHWVNLIADLDQVELWERAVDGEDIWDEVFGGFDATVDWPGGYFYRELSERYPDAKVVLSVRDAAGWEKSFSETIVEMCLGTSLMPLLSNARAEVDPRWKRYLGLVDRMFWSGSAPFTGGTSSQALMQQAEAFNQNVRDAVPADRLLEWSVSEGWGPLCEFLAVDVPAEPLPHENDRETFIGRVTDGAINALHDWQQKRLAQAA